MSFVATFGGEVLLSCGDTFTTINGAGEIKS